MGIIDQSTYKVDCDQCEITENVTIYDKGSMYGGSHWQSGKSMTHFNARWTGGGKVDPDLASATCYRCGHSARVTLL
jgi:hypothetical protein